MTVVFVATLVFFVYRNDPYIDLRRHLRLKLKPSVRV